jgi:RimJ/RimL family protein N-acetyltransferase
MGYLARWAELYVGTCGFKGPPIDNRVEIAYFTFPEFEGRRIATAMAEQLVRLVRQEAPHVIVTVRTLPEYGASTRILQRLRFRNAGTVMDPEDGQVWERVLDGDRPAPAPGAASSEV